LVGSDMSLADVGLMEVLLSIVDYFGEERFSKFKKIKVIHYYLDSRQNRFDKSG